MGGATMRNLMPIGRFSQVCRLTIKALRHYDELDLLKPALVDDDSGYRYYSAAQASQAETIRVLRSLEMPLPDIRAILHEPDPDVVRERLLDHQHRLEEKVAEYQQALIALQALVERQDRDEAYSITIRRIEPQRILGVRLRTRRALLSDVIGVASRDIRSYLAACGGEPVGPRVVLYHEFESAMENEEGDLFEIEPGWPIADGIPPSGQMAISEIYGGPVAALTHIGPYSQLPAAYSALAAWLQEHGHETIGPAREIYTVDGTTEADPARYQTEVVWPIR